MPEGAYELGIDIGTSSVVTVICRSDPRCASTSPMTFRADLTTVLAAWSAAHGPEESGGADLITPPPDLLERVGAETPVRVADRTAAAADVVAGLVRLLVDRATAQQGRAPAGTAVVVPPSWGGHRRAALVAALRAAGVADAVPVSAAVAAVRAHVHSGELPVTATAVVVDLGAATSDVAVVGPRGDGELDHRSAPPATLRWGGRDVDDAVLRHVRHCLELPPDLSGPAQRARAVALRAACRQAKEAASLETEVALSVDPAWSAAAVRLTREELEVAVADDVERVVATAVDAVAAAGTTPDELAAVVLTGGASRMPIVAERLSAALTVPLCTAADPSLTSALGAARMAADLRSAPHLPSTTDHVADGEAGAPAEGASASRPPAGRHRARDERRPGRPTATSQSSGRPVRTAPGGKFSRPPAGRAAVVAGLFVLLFAGPPVGLALLGADPGVATDGTAAAGDPTASAPAQGRAEAAALPGTSVDGVAAVSSAGHQGHVSSTSGGSSTSGASGASNQTTGTTTTQAGSTQAGTTQAGTTQAARSAAGSSTSGTAPSATATATATATGSGTGTTAAPATTPPTTPPTTPATSPPTADPTTPPGTTSDAPPTTTSEAPPSTSSSAPAPVPDPSTTSEGSTGTGSSPDMATSSAPDTQPATDPTGAGA